MIIIKLFLIIEFILQTILFRHFNIKKKFTEQLLIIIQIHD